jgi:hypothetical protein
MRHLGLTDSLLSLLANKPPQPEVLHGLLVTALALLVNEEEAGYDSFTVVDQAVQAAAISQEMSFAKGVVNAILRRFLRERAALMPQATKTPPGTWNYPTWWIDRLKGAYPEQWQAILHAGNQPPPLTLRVNRRRASVEQYLSTLQQAGMGARAVGPMPCGWTSRFPCIKSPALPRAWCRCRMPPPSSPRRCWMWPMACACWTPAPRPAARPDTCWNWPSSTCRPWTTIHAACSASPRTSIACSSRPRSRRRRP